MLADYIKKASAGEPVYISTVYDFFQKLPEEESWCMECILTLFDRDEKRFFPIRFPRFGPDEAENSFIREYVWAEIYNILSSLGGKAMDIYIPDGQDKLKQFALDLNRVFDINKSRAERRGYGRSVNVIDRMLDTLSPESEKFRFRVNSISEMPGKTNPAKEPSGGAEIFRKAAAGLEDRLICGIDVGGTDIKTVLVSGGRIICYKEYDWFPASFTESSQLIEPICLIVRLMRAKAGLDMLQDNSDIISLKAEMDKALDVKASEQMMEDICARVEKKLPGSPAEIDGVGMCFPDVVVRNKIVGGEVYKTRGIRNNPNIDYEEDFCRLTNLNDRISELIRAGGKVCIINDGPMASFTAAVETAASGRSESVEEGVFAHTLGTELGTGWITSGGKIPDIPLEVYNFIIDLGSYPERKHDPDDLRSLNNFNTGLPGTLQKYTSQSGVFRLAMKYFPQQNPGLFEELSLKGFVVGEERNGKPGLFVPTEPVDLRKPFLEYMMSLPEKQADSVNERIWREIGEFLAVTWLETKKILNPDTDARILFGRLVKRKRCFDLIRQGAESIVEGIRFEAADSSMANTPLMKQLEADPHFTVAQFAQAVGAAYFANR